MNKILIVDFGSQYCKLIARKIREIGVFSEILPANKTNIVEIAKNYQGIILSGGPNSVFDNESLTIDKKIFELGIPILGTCYGMQLIHHLLGGEVQRMKEGEYGKSNLEILDQNNILTGKVPSRSVVWMSHYDFVTKLAPGFELIAKTNLANAITFHPTKKIYTIQFHPEVNNTEFGTQFLENFVDITGVAKTWKIESIVETKLRETKETLGNKKVLLALSGGVDSSVVAALIAQVVPQNLVPVFVDNGLLRKNETQQVKEVFEKHMGLNLQVVDAKKIFYDALKGITDPEQKRKIIGKKFVEVFQSVETQHQEIEFLAQGTIYPDVIESAGIHGVAKVIKSHHNVGGLPKDIKFKIFEPLRNLFKDEVRNLGTKLGLDSDIINRHPFPGPGLGIRIIGEITAEKVRILQDVDDILIQFLKVKGIYNKVAQAAAILTPIQTVGVQGDERTYGYLVALRIVETTDFMTATFAHISHHLLDELATKIINSVSEVNRVVYDITSKPPGTIEWE